MLAFSSLIPRFINLSALILYVINFTLFLVQVITDATDENIDAQTAFVSMEEVVIKGAPL